MASLRGRVWHTGRRFEAVDFAHAGKSTAQVRDGNRTTDEESDIQGIDDFFAVPAFFGAPNEVIGDAIDRDPERRNRAEE